MCHELCASSCLPTALSIRVGQRDDRYIHRGGVLRGTRAWCATNMQSVWNSFIVKCELTFIISQYHKEEQATIYVNLSKIKALMLGTQNSNKSQPKVSLPHKLTLNTSSTNFSPRRGM